MPSEAAPGLVLDLFMTWGFCHCQSWRLYIRRKGLYIYILVTYDIYWGERKQTRTISQTYTKIDNYT